MLHSLLRPDLNKNHLKLRLQAALGRPRQFHAYCVGSAKSGTHSIATLFGTHYRALHELDDQRLMSLLFSTWSGSIHQSELLRYVKTSDKQLQLELNSSQLNYFILDILISEFTQAKFILTIRDCYSWLDSFINHQLARKCSPAWAKLRDVRFKSSQFQHVQEERVLEKHGLYTLDGYFSYWAKHNRKVLAIVPAEKLLVIRTHEIAKEIERIADFVGVPANTLNPEKAHSFKHKNKFNILSEIDKDFLEQKVHQHCKVLMDKLFPDFQQT